ncbi:hypothetical protein BDN67DRAFT_1017852 [Paxillus ammoniavirescens]|nr:hypothetical protein BDN67DRAFT_1017852 [Paxillus ammoniavirescens]
MSMPICQAPIFNLTTLSQKLTYNITDVLPAFTDPNEYQLNTHPFIIELTDAHLYLPLTLFTTEASKCLYNENWKNKHIKETHRITKVPIIILDLTTWPDESALTPITWLEASAHYINFLRICAYEKIVTQPLSQNYNARLHKHDPIAFANCLAETKLEKLAEKITPPMTVPPVNPHNIATLLLPTVPYPCQ